MAPRALALVGGLFLFAGCHFARGVGPAARIPPGHPDFALAPPEAYFVWQDGQGWHLRASSDTPRRFRGSIESIEGAISDVRQAGGLTPQAVSAGGDRIDFEFEGQGTDAGFDWKVSSGCNRFDLTIDGETRPLRVFIGAPGTSPARVPFALCRDAGVALGWGEAGR